jgi:PilZ domain
MLERIWQRLRGENDAETLTANDRRANPRHPINTETFCQPVDDHDSPMSVRVRDVSRGGMRFMSAMKMEPGTLVKISMPPSSGFEATVLACVIHSSAQTDGTYAIGCAFSDELGDDQLRQFGARKQLAESEDKRSCTRFATAGQAEYVVLPPAGLPAKRAEIANISVNGVGLILSEKVEAGAMIDLLLKTKTGEQALDILACVVFIGARPEGDWIAGCHFIHELEQAELKRLM